MLDVHPPHAPTHTWRDFLIHIATIVIGLLIAIGLEQTVEFVHHEHQRSEPEDLQRESDYNRYAREISPISTNTSVGSLNVKAAVDRYRCLTALGLPEYRRSRLLRTVPSGTARTSATWTSANTAGLLGLLSPEQSAPFSLAYELKEQAETQAWSASARRLRLQELPCPAPRKRL